MLQYFLVCALACLAQDPECPNDTVQRSALSVQMYLTAECGSGINLTIGDLQVASQPTACPAFVFVIPEHDRTVKVPGSKTYTRPVQQFPITRIDFQCESTSILGLLTLSSACVKQHERNVASVTHYAQYPCVVAVRTLP